MVNFKPKACFFVFEKVLKLFLLYFYKKNSYENRS